MDVTAKYQTYQGSNFNPAVKATPTQKPVGGLRQAVVDEPATQATPTESFTSTRSAPLRTPREGSDMAQMMEDLQNNGVIPQAQTVSPEALQSKPLREPNSEYMALMVDSIKNERGMGSESLHVQVNSNGSIALLDDSAFYNSPAAPAKAEQKGPSHEPAHGGAHGHGHGNGFKEDGLLSAHIGTEIIEKLGHNAHYAASHVSDAAGHATQAAGHATEAAGHATQAAGHGSEVAGHGSEVAGHAAEVGHGSEVANVSKEVAHHLSTGMEIALGVGTVGAGVLAVPLMYNGVKELKAGFKEKDTDKKLEGIGGIAVGTRSAATAAVMAGMLTTSEVVTQVAGVAAQTLTPLGLIHAGVDTALGVRDVARGKTTEGLLKIGTGVAIGAAALVGGIPLTVAALAMVGAKVGHKIYKKHQEKQAATPDAAQQQVANQTGNPAVNAEVVSNAQKAEVKT